MTKSELHQELLCPTQSLAEKQKKRMLTEEVSSPSSPVIEQTSTLIKHPQVVTARVLPHCNRNMQWADATLLADLQARY